MSISALKRFEIKHGADVEAVYSLTLLNLPTSSLTYFWSMTELLRNLIYAHVISSFT